MANEATIWATVDIRPRAREDPAEPNRSLVIRAMEPLPPSWNSTVVISDVSYQTHDLLDTFDAVQARKVGGAAEDVEIEVSPALFSEPPATPDVQRAYVLAALLQVCQRLDMTDSSTQSQ